ncbi:MULTISPECIES: hypothetical protein [Catenuloplanes]|uniref:Uncharacterized protein n=1 Tax=Catenuloplanes niger TaxID=587534 RepID=A0AAE3ZSL9_9ACTN|nr:hypothetical protein [Catenuloplanes niger]MDR7325323.1 hypothetical protein [Catenuloplanes niger]
MDAMRDARDLVTAHVPGAVWAILAGSVLGPHRTAGSDPDIVVMYDEGPAIG